MPNPPTKKPASNRYEFTAFSGDTKITDTLRFIEPVPIDEASYQALVKAGLIAKMSSKDWDDSNVLLILRFTT